MAGIVAVIIAVPALATDVFLLEPTPLRLGIAPRSAPAAQSWLSCRTGRSTSR